MSAAIDYRANWRKIRGHIHAEVGDDIFSSWFERMECDSVSASRVELSVPTRFLRSWIRSHYLDLLTRLWQESCSRTVHVDVVVRQAGSGRDQKGDSRVAVMRAANDMAGGNAAAVASVVARGGERVADGIDGRSSKGFLNAKNSNSCPSSGSDVAVPSSQLDSRLTFGSFVVSSSNRMAHAAALRIAETRPGQAAEFNPLLIHASVGLGKSHLLQAIAHEVRARDPGRSILYLTAERFVYGFVSALRQRNVVDFKGRLQAADYLLIDDVQFLQGKTVQQEFCHMLNALIDSSRQIVVAADCRAQELENLDERVRSRLNGGVSIEMGPLDVEQRRKILLARVAFASRRYSGFSIPDDVINYVAGKVTGSGRDLDGAFNRLLAHNQLTGMPVNLDVAKQSIPLIMPTSEPKRIMIEEIQKVVASHFNVSRADLVSSRRTRTVVRPRQIAMYLAKMLTPRSLPEIGRRFGGRDHTTVLHAVRKVEKIIDEDTGMAEEVSVLRRRIES